MSEKLRESSGSVSRFVDLCAIFIEYVFCTTVSREVSFQCLVLQ